MENMNFENAQYLRNAETKALRGIVASLGGQEISIPIDPNNRHYAEIMRQVEAGELTIQEASE
jgi:hypothetical protein